MLWRVFCSSFVKSRIPDSLVSKSVYAGRADDCVSQVCVPRRWEVHLEQVSFHHHEQYYHRPDEDQLL